MNITSISIATIRAESRWGAAVVARAVEVDVAPITRELAARVADNARDLGAQGFARWALGLPWREFCAVVQLCSGHTRRTLEAA